MRRDHEAVLVGIGTVLTDDPLLNCRLVRGPSPVRVIIDSHLRIPLDSQIVVAATDNHQPEKRKALEDRNVDVVEIAPDEEGRIPVTQMLKLLEGKGLRSLLVEGGSGMITSAPDGTGSCFEPDHLRCVSVNSFTGASRSDLSHPIRKMKRPRCFCL